MIFTDQAIVDNQTGWVEIDMRPLCDVQLRFSSWSEGLRMFRMEGGRWVEDQQDPQFSLLVPGHNKLDFNPLKPFIEAMPMEVIQAAEPIIHNQISVLRILTIPHCAQHMAAHNPVLLWLVAEAMNKDGLGLDKIRDLLNLKRVAILKEVIGTGLPSMVRFLQKVSPRNWDEMDLKAILASLRNPEILALSNRVPQIPTEVLQLCLHDRDGAAAVNILAKKGIVESAKVSLASKLIRFFVVNCGI